MIRRRIMLPAIMLAASAGIAAAQSPQTPQPQTPQPLQTQPQSYPQSSPQPQSSAVSASDSQQIQQGRGFAQQRLNTLLTGVTLTPQQRTRVDSIMLRYQPDFPAGSPENSADSSLIRSWALILPRLDNEVRLSLNPDQQPVWDRNVTQMNNRRRGVGDR